MLSVFVLEYGVGYVLVCVGVHVTCVCIGVNGAHDSGCHVTVLHHSGLLLVLGGNGVWGHSKIS